jgi:diguanylate cyclase (GGDEF)-like protein/PAS domain S-box-containing protein
MFVFLHHLPWGGLAVVLLILMVIGLVCQVVAQRRSLCLGQSREDCFRLMVDGAGDGIWLLDESAGIVYSNWRVAEMLDVSSVSMEGKNLFQFVDSQERPLVEEHFKRSRLGRDGHFEIRLRKASGGPVWVLVAARSLTRENGEVVGTLWVVTDISDRKERERITCHLTQRDPLTGLPNRTLLYDRIMHDVGRASRYGRQVGILFLDLDGFKPVNDKFGHSVGDQVLQGVAQRIVSRVRRMDTVARFGGDEFVVVLSDLAGSDEAESVAAALVVLLGEPFSAGGGECAVGVSIGISLYPEDGRSGADLIEKADAAMYAAKQAGGGRYRRYSAGDVMA